MSEATLEKAPHPSTQLSPTASLEGIPGEEEMPETQREETRMQGIAGLAATCCVCLEAERLTGCLNSEKICIVPILACLISLCLCIAGLKWVFVDKIFEYDSPTHLDPGRARQDPITSVDPTALSAWLPSAAQTSYFSLPINEATQDIMEQSRATLVVTSEVDSKPSPYNTVPNDSSLPSLAPSLPLPSLKPDVKRPTTAPLVQEIETNMQTAPSKFGKFIFYPPTSSASLIVTLCGKIFMLREHVLLTIKLIRVRANYTFSLFLYRGSQKEYEGREVYCTICQVT